MLNNNNNNNNNNNTNYNSKSNQMILKFLLWSCHKLTEGRDDSSCSPDDPSNFCFRTRKVSPHELLLGPEGIPTPPTVEGTGAITGNSLSFPFEEERSLVELRLVVMNGSLQTSRHYVVLLVLLYYWLWEYSASSSQSHAHQKEGGHYRK